MAPARPAYAPFVAASTAATIELAIMQPLDVVKTRMHLQGLGVKTGDNFGGTLAALQGVRAVEGVRGLWRGFVPGLCVVLPRRSLKFAGFDIFISILWSGEKKTAPFMRSMAAGGLTGAMEACVITPLEVVKIAMQSEKAGQTSKPLGLIAFAGNMVRTNGVSSLYSGLGATVAKHAAHSCFYFAAFHEAKKLVPVGPPSKLRQVVADLSAGFLAGCAAATANNPFDVVKTRQQVVAASGVGHHEAAREFATAAHLSMPGAMVDLVRKEGVLALYKGYVAKVARLGPGSAIIFCIYEQVMSLF